ncbi:MAG: aldehyde dehydrogenase family protein [Erythrobacter sp.]|nr:aldehyde dehydrogenase family protein [Erythrobacter sp.]
MAIGGAMVCGSLTMPVINPATGEPFAQAPRATRDDTDAVITAAREAFVGWAGKAHPVRAKHVRAFASAIEAQTDGLSALLTREQGKPLKDAEREVAGIVAWLRAAADFQLPVEVHEDTSERYCETRRVPIGVVAAIAPWNYPLLLAAFKLGPALVTGNTVVLKPSPFTPLATLKLGEIAQEIFPPGVLNVLSGDDELGPWLTSHEGIDKVGFTGSTATGKKVMRSAADTLKRLTLELGGNDPAIVMHDVDPQKIAPDLFWASFGNSGQVCVASKRVYVHTDVYESVRDALVEYATLVKVGNGMEPEIQLGPINNQLQYDRLLGLLDKCRMEGLRFACGGEVPMGPGYFLPPTIIDNPPENARIVCEEQFGPILPLIRVQSYEEAIGRANASTYALGATVWCADEDAGWALGERLSAGNVWINECRPLSPLVPFAGHRQSGLGVENGLEGLLEYTLPRTMSRKKNPIASD